MGGPQREDRPEIPRRLVIDVQFQFGYRAAMAKKRKSSRTTNTTKKPFLGNLDRLGGRKLMQQGAEESSRGKESRKHSVGGGRGESR